MENGTCPICAEERPAEDFIGYINLECRQLLTHIPSNWCVHCLRRELVAKCFQDIEGMTRVQLAMCTFEGCHRPLSERDIECILSPTDLQRYKSGIPMTDPRFRACPNCQIGSVYEDAGTHINCIGCGEEICFDCRVSTRNGHNCEEFAQLHADESHDSLVRQVARDPQLGRTDIGAPFFFSCPSCTSVFEKGIGCHHVGCKSRDIH